MIGSGERKGDLYYLVLPDRVACNTAQVPSTCLLPDTNQAPSLPDSALWHFRLGHLSFSRMNSLHSQFPFVNVDNKAICDVCHYAKHRKLPFDSSCKRAHKPFELIHFDIWGPIAVPSIHGHSYFLTAVDDYSRFTWLTLMKSKSETRKHVTDFITFIENQFSGKIKTLRSDNGPEFMMPQFYALKGILHQTSCVETPQQNARVERKHQHILNIVRALLFQSNLPKQFWSYAAIHAVYIMNRVTSPIIDNHTPYFLIHKETPDLTQLKVFGSLVYASTLQAHRSKLASRARKSVFLGYKTGMKGIVLLDINTKEIFVSRNVTHHENIFPYQPIKSPSTWKYYPNSSPSATDNHPPDISTPVLPPQPQNSTSNTPSTSITSPTPSPQLSKPIRTKHPPSYLADYVCDTSPAPSSAAITQGTPYPIASFHSLAHLSHSHKAFSLSITQSTEPKTYKEACQSEFWVKAMDSELDALAKNGTWTIVQTPPNVKPIGSKWVYKIKYQADG